MHTVEVWSADLTQPPEMIRALGSVLCESERERASRLASAARWVTSRAALRIVLAGRLGTHPGDIELTFGEHGKPQILGSGLRFNLAHSGDLAVIALSGQTDVGIDVERTARRSEAIYRTLTPSELASLNGHDRHIELLRIWCRKEAMAKADGGGLGWAPEAFDTEDPGEFSLSDLILVDGYVGALAVRGDAPEIAHYRVEL